MSAPGREVALVCAGDDPALAARLRDATSREIVPTVVVSGPDVRARRLARAAGAEITTGPVGETPGRTVLRDWTGPLLDELLERGWRLGPAGAPPRLAPVRLDGLRALHVTSVHRPDDGRIFNKEVTALRTAGADASVLGLDPRPSRARRIPAGWRLMEEARRNRADVVHIHDPELLPAAWLLGRRTGARVVYDAHEYLGQTMRTKPWLPPRLRAPAAVVVERVEHALAGGLDAVVTVTEDMAVGFAASGIDAVSVANYAPLGRFPEPGPSEERLVVYVGGVGRARGLDLMLQAFAMVDVPDARLLLAGPGEPGPLPPRVTHVGWVDYPAVPALLQRAAVVWMPQPRTPNWDRARATKVMEAMASGRPVVTSDLRRTAAMVRQAGSGLVVPYDDPAAHAAALTDLLRDPRRAAELGAAGRAAFAQRMTFEGEAAKLVDLYARLTGRAA